SAWRPSGAWSKRTAARSAWSPAPRGAAASGSSCPGRGPELPDRPAEQRGDSRGEQDVEPERDENGGAEGRGPPTRRPRGAGVGAGKRGGGGRRTRRAGRRGRSRASW